MFVHLERRSDGVALVTLDRPAQRNALSFELLRQLVEALETLDENESCSWHQRRCPLSAGRVDQRVVHAVDDESRHIKRPKSIGS